MTATANNSEEFVITRVFQAPRELIFQSWIEPERLARWWGPAGFSLSVLALELRPGGIFHYGMRSPDGYEMWGKFTYQQITAPERIVSTLSFADQLGNPVRHPMSPTWPLFTLNDMSLTEDDGLTTMVLRSAPFDASEVERATFKEGHASMRLGFGSTFDQLDAYLDTLRA